MILKVEFIKTISNKQLLFLIVLLILVSSTISIYSFSSRYNRALYLYNQGVLLEAAREVKVYLEELPDDYEANKLLARILLKLGEYQDLREVTTKLLRMRPDDQEVINMHDAAVRETDRSLPEAVTDLENQLVTDPNNIGIRIRLIDIYTARRQFGQADVHYRAVIRIRPGDAAFRLRYARFLASRNRIAEAEREYLVYLSINDNLTVRQELFSVILRDVNKLIEEKRYEEALSLFEVIVERYNEDLILLLEYARLLSWAEEFEKSITVYEMYLEQDDNRDVRLEKARVLSWNDDYGASLIEILMILEDEPDYIPALILLGDIYRWTDNMDDAKENYEYVLTLDADNMYAIEGLKELEKLKERRYEEAATLNIDAMRKALEEDRNNHFARLQLARLLGIAAQYEESAKLYKEYLQEHPDQISVRFEYSRVLSSLNDYRAAIQELQAYLRENPKDLTNRMQLVNLYLWSEDYRNGERLLQEIVAEHPYNLYAHWTLFRIYRNREDWDNAKYHLHAIIAIEPNYTVPKAYLQEIETHPRYIATGSTGMFREPSPYTPTIGFSYGYMRDHEDFSEQYGLFRYVQPFRGDNQFELSYGRFFINQYNKVTDQGLGTLHVVNDRYEAGLLATIDRDTIGSLWIGMNNYDSRYRISKNNSFFIGARLNYQLDELNSIKLEYQGDDAIQFVRTVRSLGGRDIDYDDFDDDGEPIVRTYREAAISVDKFSAEWERLPLSFEEDSPFVEKLTFFGKFGYAMFTDNNRQISYRLGASYPLKNEPDVNVLLGWESLHYTEERESEMYWSPQNYEGLFFGANISGQWEEFTYRIDGEIGFKRGSVGASRSISGRVYYAVTERLNLGLIGSYTESPREGDEDYNFLTTIIDIYYRF